MKKIRQTHIRQSQTVDTKKKIGSQTEHDAGNYTNSTKGSHNVSQRSRESSKCHQISASNAQYKNSQQSPGKPKTNTRNYKTLR